MRLRARAIAAKAGVAETRTTDALVDLGGEGPLVNGRCTANRLGPKPAIA